MPKKNYRVHYGYEGEDHSLTFWVRGDIREETEVSGAMHVIREVHPGVRKSDLDHFSYEEIDVFPNP